MGTNPRLLEKMFKYFSNIEIFTQRKSAFLEIIRYFKEWYITYTNSQTHKRSNNFFIIHENNCNADGLANRGSFNENKRKVCQFSISYLRKKRYEV